MKMSIWYNICISTDVSKRSEIISPHRTVSGSTLGINRLLTTNQASTYLIMLGSGSRPLIR